MALEATLQEVNFRRSVKKYFVDNLYTAQDIYIAFGTTYKEPVDEVTGPRDAWINFHFDGLSVTGTLASGKVAAYMFSRRDLEGDLLAGVRDELMATLIDLSMPDGIRRVPLYDENWDIIGGMLISTGLESKESKGKDNTLFKFINIHFNYAVV